MLYIILTAPVAYPARSDRVASSYWQPSNHSGCFIFITAIRFFCSVYSKKHFTCLFVGFTFFFSGSEFLFSFLLHQICIDALHDGKNILFKQKQFVLINFLYRKFYITLSYFCQYYPLAIPDFSLYAWMCGKQNVKFSFIFLIAFTQQFSSLILHRP